MELKIFLLLIFFTFFSHEEVFCQIDANFMTYPMMPNSASLFKTVDQPIGDFTGTTPIQIPIYESKSGKINMPITVNYNNGGIRVEEIASSVGLGWGLSVGGRITRSVRGMADDIPHRGFFNAEVKPSTFPGPTEETAAGVAFGTRDIEPDIYYFNINGISGKFFFDENLNIHLVDQQSIDVKVVMVNKVIRGWVLIDATGTKYYFGMDKNQNFDYTDYTTLFHTELVEGHTTQSNTYISTWHMTEIRDFNDVNLFKFSYLKKTVQFETLSSSTIVASGIFGIDCVPEDYGSSETRVTSETEEWHLKNIVGLQDSLIFNYGDREDLFGGLRLNNIYLYNRTHDLIKKIGFHYDYFNPHAQGDPKTFKRLKLKKIAEYSADLQDSLVHAFEYFEHVNLPNRLSKAVDYWGYYNGAIANTSFLPNGVYKIGDNEVRINNRADRRANPYYSVANTLSKISFPTGGERVFFYEGNQILRELDSQIHADEFVILP